MPRRKQKPDMRQISDAEIWLNNYKRIRRKDRLVERQMVASTLGMSYGKLQNVNFLQFLEYEEKALRIKEQEMRDYDRRLKEKEDGKTCDSD